MSELHDEDRALEHLLDYVHGARGLDFTGYKRNSLRRRILRRVQAVGLAEDLHAYRDYLDKNPDELALLLDSVFINVTSFFRDPEAWTHLAEEIIPELLRQKSPDAGIRVWSAGCASGEEPFSAGMLLIEALGIDQYARRVKIYATDRDEGALVQARRARYPHAAVEAVPEALRGKFFQYEDGFASLQNGLRRSVIFGLHDLVDNAPISHIDLLLCRNTIMYLNVETQARVLSRLHFALNDHGYLFLGRAEMLLSVGHAFNPVDLKHRIFAKAPGDAARIERRPSLERKPRAREEELPRGTRLREAALDASPVAQIVLDSRGRIGVINNKAAQMFELSHAALDRPIQDLELSYRPVDLRSMIDEAHSSRRPVSRKDVEYRNKDQASQYLDISITPFLRDGSVMATTITFADVSHHHKLQENLQHFSDNLETAYEELQAANEELETTNEELQSANEELETTNEELQAANEEMETVNEELRSTNEELKSVNDRLRLHENELDVSNSFLSSILSSLRAGLCVLGEDLLVQVWNELAAEMWGLRAGEVVGQPFDRLDIGLPVADLMAPLRELLGRPPAERESRELLINAVNRRGRSFACRVVLSPLARESGISNGICILMEDFTPPPAQAMPGGRS